MKPTSQVFFVIRSVAAHTPLPGENDQLGRLPTSPGRGGRSRSLSGTLIVLAMVAAAGCTVGSRHAHQTNSRRQTDLPGVDPTRAYRSLSEIEPPARDPVRPDSIRPLSERAAALVAAANSLVARQRFTEGTLKLERALRDDPDHPEIHRALATLHWQAGNFERAKTHAAQALALNDDDAGSHYLLGRCAARDSDRITAIAEFRTALRCSDFTGDRATRALCYYYLAETLAKEGYLEAALEQYDAFEQQVTAVGPTAAGEELRSLLPATGRVAALPRSVILETLGRYNQAAEALAPNVAAAPELTDLGIRYARLLARARRIDEALAAARAIPYEAGALLPLLSDICEQSDRPDCVVHELRAWSARYPDEPSIFQSLAAALVKFGDSSAALDVLQGYLERHPTHHDIRMKLLDRLVDRRAWHLVLRVGAEGIVSQPKRTDEIARKLAALADNEEALTRLLGDPPRTDEGFAEHHLRGVVAASAGKSEDAEEQFRAALSEDPCFVPSRVALANLYIKAYQYERALKTAARRNPDVGDDPKLEMVLGEVYEYLDDLAQAERHFESATQLDPADEQAMVALARVYQHSGQQLRAQRQLMTLLQRRPENEEARESLAFMHLSEGKVKEAIREFEQLRQTAATPIQRARASAIVQRLERRDPESFRKTLLDAMEESGDDAPAWLAIADSYNDYAETAPKAGAYEKVLRLDPDNLPAALGLALLEQKQLDLEASAKQLRDLLKRRPNRHRWRLGTRDMRGLLELLFVMQDSEGILAIARHQESRDDLPESTRVAYRLWIVEALLLAEKTDDALALLIQWSQEDTDHHLWADALAGEYLREDRPAEAVAVYESVLREDPQNRDARNGLVSALVAGQRYERAVQYALAWLADDPGDDRAIVMLTYALALAKRVDGALELIRNRLLTTINRESFQDLLIRHLISADRSSDAIEFTETLLGEVIAMMGSTHDPQLRAPKEPYLVDRVMRLPNDPATIDTLHARLSELRTQLATAYIAAQQYNEAERELSAWLDETRDPGARLAYLSSLASCQQIQGQDERAAETLERALHLAPENVTLNNDLAYTWTDQGVRLDDAAQMARFAVWSSPRQGAYLDTYGWLLYKKGDFSGAKTWLLRARQSNVGADPVVLDHLGDTAWRLAEREDAIKYWVEAVEAVGKRDEDAILGADARRVRDFTGRKIEAARAGEEPEVAQIAAPIVNQSRGL